MKSKSRTAHIVVVSDLHVNSTVGLYPPNLILEDGGEYRQNRLQQWLWKNWLAFCKAAPRDAIVVINGDAVQGIHPSRDSQIVTTSAKDQARAAVAVLEPLIANAKAIYVTRGTEYHDATGGADIEAISKDIGAAMNPSTGQYSRWELWLNVGGVLFNFAHHISVAPTYPATPLAKEIIRAKLNQVDCGYPIPDVIVRSHVHQYKAFPDGERWVITTPAWQLKTAYIYKKNPLAVPDIGGLVFHIENKRATWQAHRYKLPLPQIVTS